MLEAIITEGCPKCGFSTAQVGAVDAKNWPWTLRSRREVELYVNTLWKEPVEWLVALYVTPEFNLLSVETIAVGNRDSCPIEIGKIICHGKRVGAHGYFLVHNHPSGSAEPSYSDVRITKRLGNVSRELDLPLIEHFIIADGKMKGILWE